MALYVWFAHKPNFDWYLADSKDMYKTNTIMDNAHQVTQIQLNDAELEYVKERFGNLPMVKGDTSSRSVFFYGDMAKFIIGNLK